MLDERALKGRGFSRAAASLALANLTFFRRAMTAKFGG
jgi:hypothetical protein